MIKKRIPPGYFRRFAFESRPCFRPAQFAHMKKKVIVLNPPYGKRIGDRNRTRMFYRKIFEKLSADCKGWRIGIVIPDRSLAELAGFKCRISPFFHGGLDVFALTGTI